MTHRIWQTLHAESGQTILMFVIALSVIVLLLAFVIDVGGWLGTQHRLQTVADAAALSAVQSGSTAPVDDGWATIASPNVTPSNVPGLPAAVTITATHLAPIIFAGVAGIPAFTQTATATAKAAPASTLTNRNSLTKVVGAAGGPAPYVAPIVVNECIFMGPSSCLNAPPGFLSTDCFDSSLGCDLNFDANNHTQSLFGIVTPPSGGGNFSRWMMCTPVSRCASGTFATNSTLGQLTARISGGGPASAMTQTSGRTLIFPVYDSLAGSGYHISGFAAFVVTTTQFVATSPPLGPPANWQAEVNAAAPCRPTCKVIHGYFTTYSLPSSFQLGNIPGPGQQDFGVREIGLTN